ncbi:hypothetical protein ACHAXR_009282 [Thalassiosira sp. AJA248-18]
MRASTILTLLGGAVVSSSAASSNTRGKKTERVKQQRRNHQIERALSGSGDIEFDDDFWAYDVGDMDTVWDDYAIEPKQCLIYNKKHVIAFDMYGKGNKQCAKKKEGTYLMGVGQFARSYVAQKQIDYKLMGNDYGGADALDYVDCTAVEYNDVYYYAQLGCSTQGGLKLITYTDEYCTSEIGTNVGLYNDVKISFNVCQSCVSWPAEVGDDDAAEEIEVDDNFYSYHQYDSKLCGAAAEYKQSCGWGCKKAVKKGASASGNNYNMKRSWGGFEKFCLFFWSFAAVALAWIVLKQRRMMSREDAIVEEAAMNGAGLKKRHVFPIALGIIFFILFAMFMVWKKLTWILLIGTNVGLFAHFVFLRRKAKKSGGGEGYIKDAGLEIS